MSAPIPPMNPQWAMGWERANGRPPTQKDWEAQINRQRNGGIEEPTTASRAVPYAGPLGTAAGMYAASKLPGLFAAGTTAAGTGAGIAGTAAAGTGATLAAPQVLGAYHVPGAAAAKTGIYGSLSAAAPWAAGLGGAAGLYDVVSNFNDMSQTRGGLQGGLSGAALGFALGGPVGALIGAGGGGLLGSFAHKPQTKVEESRWNDLGDQGFAVPDWVANGTDIKAKGAWSRPDLAPDFIGKAPTAGDALGIGATPEGTWVNNKFATSRDEADLRPEDIWGYASMVERFGPEYLTTSEENRRAIAQKVLDLGLANEHHGTIDIGESEELDKAWKDSLTPKSANQQIADTVKETVRRYNK